MSKYIWVGLDVHLESITAAILEGDSDEVEIVKMSGDLMKVRRLFRRLSEKGTVRACYEAGGSGYVLHRVLKRDGFHCYRTIRSAAAVPGICRGALLSERDQNVDGDDSSLGGRRYQPLPVSSITHGLLRPRAIRALKRRSRTSGSHHQGR